MEGTVRGSDRQEEWYGLVVGLYPSGWREGRKWGKKRSRDMQLMQKCGTQWLACLPVWWVTVIPPSRDFENMAEASRLTQPKGPEKQKWPAHYDHMTH